jgi:hypothetical protein
VATATVKKILKRPWHATQAGPFRDTSQRALRVWTPWRSGHAARSSQNRKTTVRATDRRSGPNGDQETAHTA